MTRERKLYSIILVILLILAGLIYIEIRSHKNTQSLAPTPSIPISTPSPSPAVAGATLCRSANGLPDPSCTPGVVDSHVSQANIGTTICTKGYTARVRPPVSYTDKLKRMQMAEYGFDVQNIHDYEEDHLIPLELGGSPSDPHNLWPEMGTSPNDKDKVENVCRKKVCTGALQLSEAQQQIATDWHIACR